MFIVVFFSHCYSAAEVRFAFVFLSYKDDEYFFGFCFGGAGFLSERWMTVSAIAPNIV